MPAPALLPELLVVGDGPIGQAALDEAMRLGLNAIGVPTDALVMVEADGTVVCAAGPTLRALRPAHLLLAAEPEPRLLPIPGWTLPGVSTLAAAAPTPGEAVWVAGPGALLEQAAQRFPAARRLNLDGVTGLRAFGEDRLRAIGFHRDGAEHREPADRLVLHAGEVPAVQLTRALGCAHAWSEVTQSWWPVTDAWGATSRPNVWAAPLGEATGRIAARGVARALGQPIGAIDPPAILADPPASVLPDDATVICPCEGITAGALRAAAALGCTGLNQLKVFTRCGMGACQGRICGPLAAQVLAAERGLRVAEIAPMRVRFPLRPVTLAALAAIDPG